MVQDLMAAKRQCRPAQAPNTTADTFQASSLTTTTLLSFPNDGSIWRWCYKREMRYCING